MMDPMMGRRHQDIFEPAHFADQLRMYKDPPDLRGGIHKDDIERPEAQECQGNKIDETVQGLEDRGPESNGKIHFFRRVVCHVNCPEQAYFVIPAMQPVIQEIFREQQEEPVREYIGNGNPMMAVTDLEDQQIDGTEQQIDDAIEQHEVDRVQRIFPGIQFAMPEIA
jgi:hypothetical protein